MGFARINLLNGLEVDYTAPRFPAEYIWLNYNRNQNDLFDIHFED